MGDQAHAEQVLVLAEKGYSEMRRLFSMTKGLTPGITKEFQSKLKNARERLDKIADGRR